MNEQELIITFVEHLKAIGLPCYGVDRWPDRENRSSPDIDAIAGPFAIEHTSIDSIEEQRKRTDWFAKATNGLEQELSPTMSFRLKISWEYEAIAKGQNWSGMREAIRAWIIGKTPNMNDGYHVVHGIPGLPFSVRVWKAKDRSPGLFIARAVAEDHSLSSRIRELVDDKMIKLKPYRKNGFSTIMLIENEDIALMNNDLIIKSLRRAYPGEMPDGLDSIWFADTSIPDEIVFEDLTPFLECSPRLNSIP